MSPWPQVAEKAIKIGIAFIAVVALDTNIAPVGNPYPRALALLSMVSGAMDINTNHVGVKVTDPDMVLCNSPGPEDTMASGGSKGHSD